MMNFIHKILYLFFMLRITKSWEDGSNLLLLANQKYNYHRSARAVTDFNEIKEAQALVPKNYSIHEPPIGDDGSPIQVDFHVLIFSIRDINEVSEQVDLEINLQMYWKDLRLSHLTDKVGKGWVVLNSVLLNQIWHPDIYIDHVKKIEQPRLISTPASLRIYPDSTLRYSSRITVQMSCPMDFHFYPADTQFCNVDFKSYAYASKIMTLNWREGKKVDKLPGIKLPSFEVGLGKKRSMSVNTTSATYSVLRFSVILRRNISYHMLQTYFPSALFVLISFLSFLVAPESIPGRMTLCMTTLLTLVAIFTGVRQSTPTVSYVKGLDIWMVTCIICVFLTLVEYTVLLKLRNLKPKQGKRRNRWRKVANNASVSPSADNPGGVNVRRNFLDRVLGQRDEVKLVNGLGSNPITPLHQGSATTTTRSTPTVTEERKKKSEQLSYKIERYFSKIIPALFLIFNLVYWPWLLVNAGYFDYNDLGTTTQFSE